MKKFPRTAILVLLTLGGAWCVSQYYIKQNPLIPAPPIETIREAEELARLVATRHAAVQKSPTDTKLRWSLAQAYEQVGAVDAAARQMEIIIDQNPDFLPAHLALGNTYLARRDWKKAEDLFRFVAQRSPKAPAPWGSLAAVLYQQQKYSAAIEAGRKAVNLEPESANYRYTLGVSYLESAMLYANPESQQRTLSMARYHLLEVLSQWPDNSDIYYRLGRLYSATHRWKDAVRHLNRAEELSPGDAKVVTELIKTYIASGNSAQALKETRTALRHHPNNADLQQVLGLLLQNDPSPGADQEMYMALRKAAQLNPRLPVFQIV
jgi:Flp pilus assembly protein TadD